MGGVGGVSKVEPDKVAREKGGKKAEDASFKTLLDRLDSGLDRVAGADAGPGGPNAPETAARVVPMPGMRPPPAPLRAGAPMSSALGGIEAKIQQHESGQGLRKSGLLAACFTGGLTSLGVIWLVITYWSIGSGRGMPPIERASAAPASAAAGVASGSMGNAGIAPIPAAESSTLLPAASLVVASFAPADATAREQDPATLPGAAPAPAPSSEMPPLRSPATEVPAAARPEPSSSKPVVIAQETAPVTRPTAALPPADRSLTYAASETKLLVAPQSRAIAGESSPLAIKVDAPGLVIDRLQVIVGGLPAGAFLSAGTARGPDTWQIPVRGLESLLIRLPVATRDDVTLTLDLTDGAGASLARATTLIAVLPSALPPPQETAKAPPAAPAATAQTPPPKAAPAETSMPPRLTMDETTALIERGRLLVRNGDIASARLMFERAAEAGSGRAAYLMGETYDPDVLASLRALGLRGDIVKARQWYNRANEMGTSAAAERLRALAGR